MRLFGFKGGALASALIASAVLFAGDRVHAAVIDFEDRDYNTGFFLSSGYAGLDWGVFGSWVLGSDSSPLVGRAYAGNQFAWANGGMPLEIAANGGGLFSVQGLYAAKDFGGDSAVTITGYRNGASVFSREIAVQDVALGGQYVYAALNFSNVDKVTFSRLSDAYGPSSGLGNLLVDNLDVTLGAVVPEPATWAMMIGGFGLVGFSLRRRAAVAA